jgi:methyl acetate hydrolase
MQELLGRIARLDPSASLGLRVIACFDELVVGNVNTKALLSAAASLSGCTAGFSQDHPARSLRVSPRGRAVDGPAPDRRTSHAADSCGDLVVWLERDGPAAPNDAIVLERLALAVRVRHGRGRGVGDSHRDLGILVGDAPEPERLVAATALGLVPGRRYRVAAAPLFAVWEAHPTGPEDVVPTRFGPIHTVVLPDPVDSVQASPVGIGVAADVAGLRHSFRTALVALRLCEPPATPTVRADDFGGLADLLADAPDDSPQPDADLLDAVAAHPWAIPTVDALVRTSSVRQAARLVGVHHSTLQTRLTALTDSLGFDPADGFGRSRLATAYLVWRLRHSTVLDLPAPSAPPNRSR